MGKRAPAALDLRAPNAPAPFVARVAELRWLERTASRSPAAWIYGLPGIGKTALLARFAADLRARSASVAWIEGNPVAQLGATSVTGAIDEADARYDFVLADAIDDRDLAAAARLYARRARWIFAARTLPAGLEVPSLLLDRLSGADAVELARVWAPDADDTRASAIATAGFGIPARVREAAGGAPAPPLVPAAIRAACERLAVSSVPLPIAIARDLAGADLAALGDRIEPGDAIRLRPDLSRALVEQAADADRIAAARATAAALEATGAIALAVEAARLFLDARRPDEAARVLAARGDEIVRTRPAELWRALAAFADPALEVWRLRAAAAAALPEMVHSTSALPSAALADRLLFARTLHARGELARAAEHARAIAAESAEPLISFEAGMLDALSALHLGRTSEGIAILDALEAPSAAGAARRDALLANALAAEGRSERAESKIRAAMSGANALDGDEREQVQRVLLQATYRMGELELAGAVLADLERSDEVGVREATLDGRRLLAAGVAVRLQRGDLARARAELARLEAVESTTTVVGVYRESFALEWRVLFGELGGIEAEIAHADAVASALRVAGARANVAAARYAVALLRAEEAVYVAIEGLDPTAVAILKLSVARSAARRLGETVEIPAVDHPRVAIGAELCTAELALPVDPGRARAHAERAHSLASARGFHMIAGEALLLVADAACALGDRKRMAACATMLSELAARTESARIAGDAAWVRWAAEPGWLGALEPLARSIDVAPIAARRARAVLGESVRLDRVDEAALAALEAAGAPRASVLRDGPDPAWGMSKDAASVWLPDGARVDLAAQPTLRAFLLALALRGGVASKEAVVLAVWNPPEYHPLRHGGRLRSALRNLRDALGEGTPPALVLTTPDGYELGGRPRIER